MVRPITSLGASPRPSSSTLSEANNGSTTLDGGALCLNQTSDKWIILNGEDSRICDSNQDCQNAWDEKDCTKSSNEALTIALVCLVAGGRKVKRVEGGDMGAEWYGEGGGKRRERTGRDFTSKLGHGSGPSLGTCQGRAGHQIGALPELAHELMRCTAAG